MSILEWLSQFVLVLLLGATITFSIRLDRALKVIRDNKGALEGTTKDFDAALKMSQAAITHLRSIADGVAKDMAERVSAAESVRKDLPFLIERAEKLADRLETIINATRPLEAKAIAAGRSTYSHPARDNIPTLSPLSPPAEVKREKNAPIIAPGSLASIDGGDALAPRTQAERELLAALKRKNNP
jgi:hypothetical protein